MIVTLTIMMIKAPSCAVDVGDDHCDDFDDKAALVMLTMMIIRPHRIMLMVVMVLIMLKMMLRAPLDDVDVSGDFDADNDDGYDFDDEAAGNVYNDDDQGPIA